MDIREAERNLELIRSYMERATRWTGLPAYACFGAAMCGFAGWAYSAARGLDFAAPAFSAPLLEAWVTVAAIAAVQVVAFTVLAARKRGEPALSNLTRSIVWSMLPGLFTGGVLTLVVPPAQWPGVWMLCYGTALLGMGLFAGWKANVVGILFLATGALSLLVLKTHGLALMALGFGGLHALLGALCLIRPGDRDECVEG
jgi:hypothetical protein